VNITIYTRQDCPLCLEGISSAVAVFGRDRVTLVDIDLDLSLIEKYTDRVPVVETSSGEIIAEGIISVRTLRECADPTDSTA